MLTAVRRTRAEVIIPTRGRRNCAIWMDPTVSPSSVSLTVDSAGGASAAAVPPVPSSMSPGGTWAGFSSFPGPLAGAGSAAFPPPPPSSFGDSFGDSFRDSFGDGGGESAFGASAFGGSALGASALGASVACSPSSTSFSSSLAMILNIMNKQVCYVM